MKTATAIGTVSASDGGCGANCGGLTDLRRIGMVARFPGQARRTTTSYPEWSQQMKPDSRFASSILDVLVLIELPIIGSRFGVWESLNR